ncbi:GAF domain-containing protein [Pedococcus bigeumensis]|uniref:GAF domain-containing protein n=1 Tax=Pedococcus bigeumensis TaxID=433644 RepID=UPI0031E2246B
MADTVCELALRTVGGDHASITSIRAGHFTTVAATSEVPELADKIQSKVGTGPCLDAIRESDTVRVDDLATDTRWPRSLPLHPSSEVWCLVPRSARDMRPRDPASRSPCRMWLPPSVGGATADASINGPRHPLPSAPGP